ncbi:MAG: solute-binding protein [Deltaproteobacteria bacterium]|jgi:molybdate transport system substrate-binding protein|nr:solute-binding protein [Deltaproteobacteria bacterium]MBT4644546.1 solute-binding protein [Deltaproteobacteria bacterium]MBT6501443.1 solute-binding protein [Deltaproteobacteria bacterium]MBT7151052.1 solute-binding protein [Deltaproteobacteria bacterium]MBT7713694.1 solute-binding protein [Deltaproteobacteria bacterium]
MNRRGLIIFATILLLFTDASAGDLYWYLAASMAKPGKEIVSHFNQKQAPARVFLILGGSGQLLSKIELARRGDIYTPASAGFLKKAREKKLVKSQRLLLYQKPVFGLSGSGRSKINTFSDLSRPGLKLALGNPRTMALGATYLQIEEKMGRALSGQIRANSQLEAINISQVVNYLRSDVVDAGIIFDTVAQANGLSYIEIPERFNILSKSFLIRLVCSTAEEADLERFETFILTQHQTFNKYGFQLVGSP